MSFATTVTAATKTTTSRDGRKFLVSDVFATMVAAGQIPSCLTLGDFKALLLKASRERKLHLTRCDMVCLFDAAKVEASTITYQSAEFHFVTVD